MRDNAYHILAIDDDNRIRELLQTYLISKGFRVSTAANSAIARKKMQILDFDLLILDVMMPGEDGKALAKTIRGNSEIPIIMLSACGEIEDRIEGLEIGVDDYIPKPFEPKELLLRINNILKRSIKIKDHTTQIVMGSCQFNVQRGELKRNGENIHLTTKERDILRIFSAQPGKTFSREELFNDNEDGNYSGRAIDVSINRLRQKIEDDPSSPIYLQTVRGVGYILHSD